MPAAPKANPPTRTLLGPGPSPVHPRVLPQIGAVVNYRSIYIDHGIIHADAIRVPYFGSPQFKAGGTLPVVTLDQLVPPLTTHAAADFAQFADLSDGYIARSPVDGKLLADLRYTYRPEGLEPVWGVRLENVPEAMFTITPRAEFFGRLLGDLFKPKGYLAMPQVPR